MLEKLGSPGYRRITRPDGDFIKAVEERLAMPDAQPVVAEIGVGIGATTVQIAERLNGRGEIHIFDFEAQVQELKSDLAERGFQNVVAHGNTSRYWDSYHWSLAALVAQRPQNSMFDVVYIDGAHTYLHDALAFFMCDRLLKDEGTMIFDDYGWRYADSKYMRNTRLEYMTPEQIDAFQIKMFVDDLVATHERYSVIIPNKSFRKLRSNVRSVPHTSEGTREHGGARDGVADLLQSIAERASDAKHLYERARSRLLRPDERVIYPRARPEDQSNDSSAVQPQEAVVGPGPGPDGLLLPPGLDGSIGGSLKQGRWYEEQMLRYIAGLGVEGIYVDVGAQIGNHTLFFATQTKATHVFAIEPGTKERATLGHLVQLNHVEEKVSVLPFAAGHARAMVEFRFKAGSREKTGQAACVRLDDVLPSGVALMKVDVEGMECDVLRGATRILEEDRPRLFVEALDDAHLAAVMEILKPFGYDEVRGVWNASPTYELVCARAS